MSTTATTKSDIDNFLSGIADNPELTKYMRTELDQLEKRQVIRNVVNNTKLRFCSNYYEYEDEEEDSGSEDEGSSHEDEETENERQPDWSDIICSCGYTSKDAINLHNVAESDVREALKLFAKDFTYKLEVKYSYNDGCKWVDSYKYIMNIDSDISVCFALAGDDRKSYMKNKHNNYKWDWVGVDKYSEWGYDRVNSLFDKEYKEYGYPDYQVLCDKLDPRIYNTTPAWKFLKEKYDIPDANLCFILHQFLYLLMDAFIVQPPDDD